MGLLDRFSGRRERLPDAARDAIALGSGERLLAWAQDDVSDVVVAATTQRLHVVGPDGDIASVTPWHLVQAGAWRPDDDALVVTLVDGGSYRWVFEGEPRLLLETVRERVQASVVLAQQVELGPRRRLQVAIRKDLATGELSEQVVPGPGVRRSDPDAAELAAEAAVRLRDEVGL